MWNTGTDEAYQTKLSMAILTGELPDYIYVNNNQFKQLVDAGYAADITDAYDNYLYPHVKETAFEAYEEHKSLPS